jgi:hypothetical protein
MSCKFIKEGEQVKLTVKERKELDEVFKQLLKLCDQMDEILDRIDQPELAPKGLPKVYLTREHYA